MSELALDFGNLKGLRFRELCTTQTTTEVSLKALCPEMVRTYFGMFFLLIFANHDLLNFSLTNHLVIGDIISFFRNLSFNEIYFSFNFRHFIFL